MELRRELSLSIGTLVVLNLLLAFGAIGLLGRMGPAVERILEENVESIVAAEEIVSELAAASGLALDEEAAERVRDSLARARRNVTEPAEEPVLEAIDFALEGAVAGTPASRRRLVAELRELIRINRAAMARADEEAKRLGSAGAWAAVLAGMLSFAASLLVVTRLQRRFARPLADLYDVLESVRTGNPHRRCRAPHAPVELVRVARSVNRLLDERLEGTAEPTSID